MICCHLRRSRAKLVPVVAASRVFARSLSMTSAQQGDELHPFCGALIRTSTPLAVMSTQIAPEATQSRTNRPPPACTASATARR